MPDRIASSLRALEVPIDSVMLHPQNAREGDVGALCESLKRFGQMRPIIVQSQTGFVVAGNHLLRAARALGWTTIAAHAAELSEADASAYLLADNRLSEVGWYDPETLAALLTEQALAGNLAGTGYDGDDVDEELSGHPKMSMEVVTFNDSIVWDDGGQLARWRQFMRWLKGHVEAETPMGRLDLWLSDVLGDEL